MKRNKRSDMLNRKSDERERQREKSKEIEVDAVEYKDE